MKLIAIATCFLTLGVSTSRASDVVLPYSAFGPQVAAYELIGMEWWQWESHGDGTGIAPPIKVVVFWDQSLEETAKRHPVNQEKLQDFRYVEYSKAIEHMTNWIKNFKEAGLATIDIERGLADLQKAYGADRSDAGGRRSVDD